MKIGWKIANTQPVWFCSWSPILPSTKLWAETPRKKFWTRSLSRGIILQSEKHPRCHKIFLYKEDFNRFAENLNDVIDYIKTELMPDYDYDEYAHRYKNRAYEYNSDDDDTTKTKNDREDEIESW